VPDLPEAQKTNAKARRVVAAVAWIGLSLVAGIVLWWLLRTSVLWRRIACVIIALACAIVCFTTVGRLSRVPGPVLAVATIVGFYAAPAAGPGSAS
jgi:hypothetical protein